MNARLMQIIQGPVVSEKATNAGELNQYVFRVLPDAEKDEIKAAIEQLFEVRVAKVRTLNQQGKKKRFGRLFGRRNHWKKAYVSLVEGENIDLGEGEQA